MFLLVFHHFIRERLLNSQRWTKVLWERDFQVWLYRLRATTVQNPTLCTLPGGAICCIQPHQKLSWETSVWSIQPWSKNTKVTVGLLGVFFPFSKPVPAALHARSEIHVISDCLVIIHLVLKQGMCKASTRINLFSRHLFCRWDFRLGAGNCVLSSSN